VAVDKWIRVGQPDPKTTIARRINGAVNMKRSEHFLLQNIGGQDLLVPLAAKVMDMNALITLNATGRCVWELLGEDRAVEYLVAEVAKQFDVDSARARADVVAFLEDLGRLGLLET
jgi:hypothetical protein